MADSDDGGGCGCLIVIIILFVIAYYVYQIYSDVREIKRAIPQQTHKPDSVWIQVPNR